MKTFSLLLTWYLTTLWFLVFSVFLLTFISTHKISSLNLAPHYQYYKALPSNGSIKLLESSTQADQQITLEKKDARALLISDFLTFHKSKLVDYSEKFVSAADKNSIDYRLLPAIAIYEHSNKKDHNNPFGYLDPVQKMVKFESLDSAIDQLSVIFKTEYFASGLKTPEEIRAKYPSIRAEKATWSEEVDSLIESIR